MTEFKHLTGQQHRKTAVNRPAPTAGRARTAPPSTVSDFRFASFWSAGFESASHINRHGRRLDLIAAIQHDHFAEEDYRRLHDFDMRVARDGVRWPLIDRGGAYDFSSFLPMLRASIATGIQVNWILCHYGWPDGLDVFSSAFVARFASYAAATASVVSGECDHPPCYTLINEPSFLAWAAADAGMIHPRARGRGHELKRQIARATMAATDAIRSIDRRARFIHVDPIIHVVTRQGHPEDAHAAHGYTQSQYEAMALLTGEMEPELGGRADYLDIVGCNYYHSNQWELEGSRLRWEDEPLDARWVPLSALLQRAWKRFRRPMLLAETSHFGIGRPRWVTHLAKEIVDALDLGLPLQGVCLYPIIDRPDWEDPNHWHNSGLWDLETVADGTLRRVLNQPYADALRRAQRRVDEALKRRRQTATP